MANWRIPYWLLVGALLGLGVISILSIGLLVLPVGLILLAFGAIRFGGGRLWAALVGFGAAPALLLLWDVTSQPWACNPGGPGLSGSTTQTGVNYFTCVNTFVGPLTTYHVMAAIFGAIALVGLLWGLAALLWGTAARRNGGHAVA
ncbi:MAG TPA: hypothetical protein VFN78_02720 [Ktedonobacterales bacterium]|nr:hypothetical protein [Ktedonobacterales bacterium]